MKYVSIDLETTGLDNWSCSTIEIGAVIDEVRSDCDPTPIEDLPTYHAYLVQEEFTGEPYALSMHPTIFRRIATREEGFKYLEPGDMPEDFANFLLDNGFARSFDPKRDIDDVHPVKITVAGKNFASFDSNFLNDIQNWKTQIKVRHRVIDPSGFYWNPFEDEELPNTELCLKRAEIDETVEHTAVADAQNVIRLIRSHVARIKNDLEKSWWA